MDQQTRDALRRLPSIDSVVRRTMATSDSQLEEPAVTALVRQLVSATRDDIQRGDFSTLEQFDERLEATLELLTSDRVRTVINGTGVIIHTNLGRSPISVAAARAMSAAATHYVPLEVRLDTGERGGRGEEIETLIRTLTGAESTLAVNNNAAAILLTLSALCSGKRVIVSRGEAVEIGGGFRIPDVLRQSGAHLVEVGTTNRTNLDDLASVVDDETAAILSVHASNFQITGFTRKPELSDLAQLAHDRGILLIEDVGSGCLVETRKYGLDHEPTLAESIAAGVDVVTASGDKLLGGPQAGLILGSEVCLRLIRQHPLARAVRTDKSVQHGLAATLRHYIRGEQDTEVPIWWMMSRSQDELRARARRWCASIGSVRCTVTDSTSVTGGGSLPGKTQPSFGLALQPSGESASELARRLRVAPESVFPRVENDQVIIDARTVLPDQDDALTRAVRAVLDESAGLGP